MSCETSRESEGSFAGWCRCGLRCGRLILVPRRDPLLKAQLQSRTAHIHTRMADEWDRERVRASTHLISTSTIVHSHANSKVNTGYILFHYMKKILILLFPCISWISCGKLALITLCRVYLKSQQFNSEVKFFNF